MSTLDFLHLMSDRNQMFAGAEADARRDELDRTRHDDDGRYVVVGGCHGLFLLPACDLANFYKGNGYVALLAMFVLGLYLFIRTLT
jgi:hypothetical protein